MVIADIFQKLTIKLMSDTCTCTRTAVLLHRHTQCILCKLAMKTTPKYYMYTCIWCYWRTHCVRDGHTWMVVLVLAAISVQGHATRVTHNGVLPDYLLTRITGFRSSVVDHPESVSFTIGNRDLCVCEWGYECVCVCVRVCVCVCVWMRYKLIVATIA